MNGNTETLNPGTSSQGGRMPEYSTSEEEAIDTEPVQLQPFIHQVGGHSCVLKFNETTLCKPLITREQFFYESLPVELKEFIPDYRGLVEVELQEDTDGQITLIGYPVQGDNSKGQRSGKRLQRSSPKPYERGTSPNSSGSETENSQSPVLCSKNKHARRSDNSYSMRLLRSGSIEVSTHTETMFHTPDPKSELKSAGVNPWSLKCHKRQLAKMRTDNQDSNLKKFILIENVAAKFKFPCILDLKMGTRQHGDDAPEAKKHSQMRKCAKTTSKELGVRLIGMQVYQSSTGQFVCQNKYYGRELSVAGFKDVLELFLTDGDTMRLELLDPILNRLKNLYTVIEKQDSFRFYSSSLLIMYGGCENENSRHMNGEDTLEHNENVSGQGTKSREQEGTSDTLTNTETDVDLVDVRMIDFAHSTHSGFQNDEKHRGVDQGYLFGLQNLIDIFEKIRQRYTTSGRTENG